MCEVRVKKKLLFRVCFLPPSKDTTKMAAPFRWGGEGELLPSVTTQEP